MLNNSPLISVVLPVYNGGDYLDDSISSILSQTFEDFELIIINDGSTDQTHEIIQKHASNDMRVRYIEQHNQGLIYSLNKGINVSRGKYIARMDADDISHCDRFKLQVELLNSGVDICGCHFYVIDKNSEIINAYVMPTKPEEFCVTLSQNVPFAHGSVMFKKDFFQLHKLEYSDQDCINAEDYFLWCRFFNVGAKFGNVDSICFYYRELVDSLSKNKKNGSDATKIAKDFFIVNKIKIIECLKSDKIYDKSYVSEHAASTLIRTILKFHYDKKIFDMFLRVPIKFKILSLFKILKTRG